MKSSKLLPHVILTLDTQSTYGLNTENLKLNFLNIVNRNVINVHLYVGYYDTVGWEADLI